MKRLEATVYGRVQGVSFRYYTQQEANRLGLVGWVANRPNGTVMVIAEGREDSLRKLEQYLRQGPPLARVDRLQVAWFEAKQEFLGFQVRYR